MIRHRYLCWLDLETTGLDPIDDLVLEVAFVLSEPVEPFRSFDSFSCVVAQTPEQLNWRLDANEFVGDMHRGSGLAEEVVGERASSLAFVEKWAIDLLDCWGTTGDFLLCGSGVARFDRRFLEAQLPTLDGWLRPEAELDVGQLRRLLEAAGRADLLATDTATKAHRALPDARDHHREFVAYAELLGAVPAP